MHVRCPHCSNPIALSGDEVLSDLSCPSCGSHFQLVSDDTTTLEQISRPLAHFELLHQVGVGRFGTVWKARDTKLDRFVAIKIPRQENLDAESEDQFFREARAAAQLKHPHIVSVHEVGREDGTIYIVCDLIDGADLSGWLRGNRLTAREAAELCVTIADALQHAHECGVVHRDLKPSNILIDRNGTPYLADFGLAKRESGEATITIDGKLLGTPAYMSPEQARGEAHSADRRSDIYSVGVVLYELLTGQRPFRGERRMLILQILNDEPVPPRRLNSHIPRDLETICLKCMEKEPSARYASARELADDLRHFLAGEPIMAHRVGTVGRTVRWARRNRAVAGLLLAIMAILLTATGISSYFAWRSGQDEVLAKQAAERASTEAARATDSLYDSLVQEIRATIEARQQGYGQEVRDLIRRAVARDTPRVDQDELRRLLVLTLGDFVAYPPEVIEGLPEEITAARLSGDARELVIGLLDGQILYQAPTRGAPRYALERLPGPIAAIAASPQGDRLVAADLDGNVRVWRRNGSAWQQDRTFSVGTDLYAVVTAPQAEYLAVLKGSTLQVWDVDSGTVYKDFPTEPGWTMRSAAFDVPNGLLAAAYMNRQSDTVGWVLYDLEAPKKLQGVEMPSLGQAYPTSIAIGSDGRQLAVGFDEALLFYDLVNRQQTNWFRGDSTKAVAISPAGRYLASVDIRGSITLRNVASNREIATLFNRRRKASRENLSFSEDGSLLVASNARTIRVWDLSAADERTVLDGHDGGVPCALFHKQSGRLITGGKDDFVRVWDPATGRLLDSRSIGEAAQSLAVTPDGSLLAVGSMGREGGPHLRLLDATSLEILSEFPTELGHIHSLKFRDDPAGTRRYLAACGQHGVMLWEVQSGEDEGEVHLKPVMEMHPGTTKEHPTWCLATDISSDAQWMVWTQRDADKKERLQSWNIREDRAQLLETPAMNQGWHGAVFLPNSDAVIYVSEDGLAEIWSVGDDRRVASVGSSGKFNAPHIALSRDGRLLAALTEPDVVSVWNTASGTHLFSLRSQRSTVWSLAWDDLGDHLAVGRSDGSLAVWHLSRIRTKLQELGLDWSEDGS